MRHSLPILLLVLAASVASAQDLEVFQDLEEITARIPNLGEKPHKVLIDAHGGFFQPEVVIFKDVETGKEIWSLSRELCIDMAHTGRRPAWSGNGQHISFRGNQAFWSFSHRAIRKRTWAGYSYIANADGSKKRPVYASVDGKVQQFNCAKYNMWDVKKPGTWYTITKGVLWRVTVKDGLTESVAEAIFTFPSTAGKVIQEISDENFMLVEESGKTPNCYVLDLNRDPKDAGFCMSYPLKGEVHSGSFRFKRSRRIVTGGYEFRKGVTGRISLGFSTGKLVPEKFKVHITEGRRMGHLWFGPPDDRVGFFGKYKDKRGLFLQMPGAEPVRIAVVPDGHATWCGRDPEWFFGAVGPGRTRDKQYARKLLACNADGKTIEIVCTPYDRRRPGAKTYMTIPLPTQSRDGNKCWYHSSMLLPDNKYTGSYIAVHRRPRPPVALKTSAVGERVTLEWTPHAVNFEVKGYHVYRMDDAGKTWIELTDAAVAATTFTDTTARPGRDYTYAVTAEEWSLLESDVTSPTVMVGKKKRFVAPATGKPVSGWDKTPPRPVANFTATKRADGLILLKWNRNKDRDFRHYQLYASPEGKPAVSQKRLLVSPPHGETFYLDWSAPKGRPMHYAITTVDRQGNESPAVYASLE